MLGLSIEVSIVLSLILLNGVFAMAEISVVSSRRLRLQQNAENGGPGAAAAYKLAEDPTRFLSTVQIGITVIGIVAGVFGGTRIAGRISDGLEQAGLAQSVADPLGYFLVVFFITYLSVVFGEIVPKRIGLHGPEKNAARVALPMQMLSRVAAPFVLLLTWSANSVLRILNLKGEEEASLTEQEIRLMIGMSAEQGTVAEDEAELLDRVFHFGDRKVHEVMVPRTEAVYIDSDATVADFYRTYQEASHSRFPVIEGGPDHVVGILGIKSVLAKLAEGELTPESPVLPMVQAPFFVPETKVIGELFREMQASGTQMAIAVDEFGGTAGIVTLESMLEEMVGPVGDELRPTDQEILHIDERTTHVDGTLSIEEVREELGIELPDGPYDTIAGFVLNELGRIPAEGDQFAFDGHQITVEKMRGPKIELLRLTRL